MKKINLIIIMILFLSASYSQSYFSKTINTNFDDYGYAITQTSDGGYVLAGAIYDDICIIRLNHSGNLIWGKILSTGYVDEPADIIENINASDTSYIIAGKTSGDICLISVSSLGAVLWSKQYGGSGIDEAKKVLVDPIGGYTILGTTTSFGVAPYDIYIIHTNDSGTIEWSKVYDTGNQDYPNSMTVRYKQPDTVYYVITGTTRWDSIGGNNDNDAFFLRISGTGDVQYFFTYPNYGYDEAKEIQGCQIDSGFYFAGIGTSYCTGCMFIGKLSETGLLAWVNSVDVGYNTEFLNFKISPSRDLFISCTIDDTATLSQNFLLVRLDSTGIFQWARHYDASSLVSTDDVAANIAYTNDGGIVLIGTATPKIGSTTSQIFVTKTIDNTSDDCADGIAYFSSNAFSISTLANTIDPILITGETSGNPAFVATDVLMEFIDQCPPADISSYTDPLTQQNVFPNPASELVTITLPEKNNFTNEINVYDCTGILMYSTCTTEPVHNISIQNWSSGIYFVWIKSMSEVVTLKLIKQ